MFPISKVKNIFVKVRTSIKLISLILISIFLIVGVVAYIYKPIYSVTINGEFIGYTDNKSKLQKKINDYLNGNGENNLAFIEVANMPKYELCLLKKNITTNDDEIFQKVIENGVNYYHYYAVLEDSEIRSYVKTVDEAENIIKTLKEKYSNNQDHISFIEIYETGLQEFEDVETVVAKLYEAPVIKKRTAVAKSNGAYVSTSREMSNDSSALGISLIRPINGTISSRFGARSSIRSGVHTGLDIAAPKGTPIKAAATGTVIYAGNKGSLGNLVVLDHGNGIQTYYGHCNSIDVNVGDEVSQGAVIARVGSTGNSTGYHLHLEIRVNGVARNPQNYLY